MPNLRNRIETILSAHLAYDHVADAAERIMGEFAAQILADITPRTDTKTAKAPKVTKAAAAPKAPKAPKGKRVRRSIEQIQAQLATVVTLLKKKPGIGSEEIRKTLSIDKNELPRVLKEGTDGKPKTIKYKGDKRARTYTAV